jgi:L-alanine-DL-glutamate epimerase-like enolase superfamily enzyme
MQIAAVAPNFHVLETVHPEYDLRRKVGGDAMEIQDGYMHLHDSPGLGLADLDLSALEDEAHGDEPVYAWRAFSE